MMKRGNRLRDMNRGSLAAIGAALVLSVLVTIISVPVSANVVTFPDPGLEAAIRDAINKPTGDIHDTNLLGVTLLSAGGRSIANLEGIQYCADLAEVYLFNNNIVDISPLSVLTNLTRLKAGNNEIVDTSPLSSLLNLTRIDLYMNGIGDISSLSSLLNLTSLSLYGNEIVDISPLSGLTNLETLFLNSNQIIDISPLSSLLDLTDLGLSNNQIVNINSLSDLTNLVDLGLSNNQISNISSLSGLTNLTRLDLYGNEIVDVSSLVGNTGIGEGDVVTIHSNYLCLTPGSQNWIDIETLRNRGADVSFHPQHTDTGAPDIYLQGGDPPISIADGDTTPSLADNTDFGSADIATGAVDHVIIIHNAGSVGLPLTGTPPVSISGAHADDFLVTSQPASQIGSGETTTFTVRFNPSAVGLRTATISIPNRVSSKTPYDFAIQGTGTNGCDIDANGEVNALDVQLCLQIALATITGTADQRVRADVDLDGDIDLDDAMILAEFVLGIRTTLPGGESP